MISLKLSENMHFYLWIIIKGIVLIVIINITGPRIIYNKIKEKLRDSTLWIPFYRNKVKDLCLMVSNDHSIKKIPAFSPGLFSNVYNGLMDWIDLIHVLYKLITVISWSSAWNPKHSDFLILFLCLNFNRRNNECHHKCLTKIFICVLPIPIHYQQLQKMKTLYLNWLFPSNCHWFCIHLTVHWK